MIASLAIAAALVWACIWITDRVVWQHESIGFLGVYFARLLLLVGAAVVLFAALAVTVKRPIRWRFGARCVTAGLATALTLLCLEVVFMFVPQSHNVGYTLATRIWYDDYWGSENSLGYRDPEPVRIEGKKLVFALGDSFTAGAGIKHIAQRYPDVLAAARPDLQVMNLGASGSETVDEFRRLQRHPLRPDLVVLQYYPNDIDGAAERAGHSMPSFVPYQDLRSVKMRLLVRGSFLANFAYWQFPHSDGLAYEQWLMQMHTDAQVAQIHHRDLEQFCDWSQEHHAQLVVVLFPMLEDLAWSRKVDDGVKQLFERHHVPVLDVADLIEDLSVPERLVNHHDGHASVEVHRRVGIALARFLST